jgi:hypothetical protein
LAQAHEASVVSKSILFYEEYSHPRCNAVTFRQPDVLGEHSDSIFRVEETSKACHNLLPGSAGFLFIPYNGVNMFVENAMLFLN